MQKKRIMSVLLGLILLAAASPGTAIAESENLVDIALEPPSITGVKGETIEVTIRAIPNGQKMAAMDVFLDFDAAYLEVVDVQPDEPGIQIEPGTTLALPLATKVDNSRGEITYCAGMPFGMDSPDDAFTVASVTFRLKEDTAGATEITFHTEMPRQTMVAYKGNPVLGSLTGTAVTVSAATATRQPVQTIIEIESTPIAPVKPAATQTLPPSPAAPPEVSKPVQGMFSGMAWWMILVIIGLVVGLGGLFVVKIRGGKPQ
jgi:hypothetical protein